MAKTFYSTGRRKTASARIFLKEGSGLISINDKKMDQYFKTAQQQKWAAIPLKITETEGRLDLKITVKGGGLSGQSESIRHGLARALVLYSPSHRGLLKKNGFLLVTPEVWKEKNTADIKLVKELSFLSDNFTDVSMLITKDKTSVER